MHDSTDFKVGIAIDVQARAASLPEKINLQASLCVECTTLPARKLEQMLHSMFHQYRLPTHQGDGCTEWFDGACFEKVRDFIVAHCSLLGCSAPKPVPITSQSLSPAPRSSREEARRRRREEWERAKAASAEISNAVIRNCLGLLRSAVSRGALKGRGHWKNQFGTREEFIVFAPAPESLAWQECLSSMDPHVRPWVSVCYETRAGESVGHCYSNYTLCPTSVYKSDGSGWHVINRPEPKLNNVTPMFEELNLFLECLPPLTVHASRTGRAILKHMETEWHELLSNV